MRARQAFGPAFFLFGSAVLLFSTGLHPLHAQEGPELHWEESYPYDEDRCLPNAAIDVVIAPDGGYVLAGGTTTRGSAGLGSQVRVVKLNVWGTVEWERTYGGEGDQAASALAVTPDGGYVVVGHSNSGESPGGEDGLVLRLDGEGELLWQRTVGGKGDDMLLDVVNAPDGGYAVAGVTDAGGSERTDGWLLELDEGGDVIWRATYGGDGWEDVSALVAIPDGGYVLAGYTTSRGSSASDAWVAEVDRRGTVEWEATYGGDAREYLEDIVVAPDGGYAVTGWREHADGAGADDAYLVKLDERGTAQWEETYGGDRDDRGHELAATPDGGFAVTGYRTFPGNTGRDLWVLKTDRRGTLAWDQTFGGAGSDQGNAVVATSDGGLLAAGFQVGRCPPNVDFHAVKLGY